MAKPTRMLVSVMIIVLSFPFVCLIIVLCLCARRLNRGDQVMKWKKSNNTRRETMSFVFIQTLIHSLDASLRWSSSSSCRRSVCISHFVASYSGWGRLWGSLWGSLFLVWSHSVHLIRYIIRLHFSSDISMPVCLCGDKKRLWMTGLDAVCVCMCVWSVTEEMLRCFPDCLLSSSWWFTSWRGHICSPSQYIFLSTLFYCFHSLCVHSLGLLHLLWSKSPSRSLSE